MIKCDSVYDIANELWIDSQRSDLNKIEISRSGDMLNNIAVSASPNIYYKNSDSPSNKLDPVRALFKPVRIWFTPGGYTTVEWSDGTKTTAHAENEETANQYCGFCACVVKKLYGSTTKAMKLMQDADEKAKEPAKKRQEEMERRKKEKQYKVEHDQKLREARIQLHMRDIREKREANCRIVEADERSEYEQ